MFAWFRKFLANNAVKGYPRVTSRISRDKDFVPFGNNTMSELLQVPPTFSLEFFKVLDNLFLIDPYFAKFHQTTIALGNTGHKLAIDAPTEAKANQAIELANDLAARCYPLGGGMDGLVNGLFSQIARAGGLCVEWVPDQKLTLVDKAYLVPIATIRFRYLPDLSYQLCQEQPGEAKWVALNTVQTSYHAVYARDGNPYPIPPALSAIESAANHRKINASIKQWMDKLSALGVLLAEVEPPPRLPGETQEAYDAKARTFLDQIATSISDNFESGLGVGYNNIKFQFQNTQAGAQGAKDVLQIVLQGLFAGLQRDPIFFGWNFNSTETFASVVYQEMMRSIQGYQLGVKRALEHGHRLNLALQGLGDVGVSIYFDTGYSLDSFRDAQAEAMEAQSIISQVGAGIITVDEAREILGHEEKKATSGAFVASYSQVSNQYNLTSAPEKKTFGPLRPVQSYRDGPAQTTPHQTQSPLWPGNTG